MSSSASFNATTLTLMGAIIFFFASAGASAAYLTASEVFPMETRALCIAFFYAIGTAVGGISGPLLFGWLIDRASESGDITQIAIGYFIGAALMVGAGIVAAFLGVKAEGESLERHRPAADRGGRGRAGGPDRPRVCRGLTPRAYARSMDLIVILALIAVVVVLVGVTSRRNQARELERRNAELEPVKKLAYEDITALGTELQALDAEVSGVTLDEGAQADYQRALDAYEDAKVSGDAMTAPDDIKHVTGILDDGRYAIACVRARVAGEPLPTRRPPCFFDPRHGPSVTDVDYAPAGGATRSVPSCALDAERVGAGADPAVRQVMVGSRRVPYWQGGPAYAPYAAGYFAAGAGMSLLFGGLLIGVDGRVGLR